MTQNQENALNRIKEQQKNFKEGEPCYGLAEQLMDICRAESESAQLIFDDLSVEAMGIRNLEKEIKKFADEKHKKNGGNSVCITPKEADTIIRKFYSLPGGNEAAEMNHTEASAPSAAPASDIINLDDFFS